MFLQSCHWIKLVHVQYFCEKPLEPGLPEKKWKFALSLYLRHFFELLTGRLHFNHLQETALANLFPGKCKHQAWTGAAQLTGTLVWCSKFYNTLKYQCLYYPTNLCQRGLEVERVALNKMARKEEGRRKARVKVGEQE